MKIKITLGILLVLLLVTSVSADIVYPDQFYKNGAISYHFVTDDGTIGGSVLSTVFEIRNTNILLIKQNELLQEHNNLTKTQNEILRGIYNVLNFGVGWSKFPPLDV